MAGADFIFFQWSLMLCVNDEASRCASTFFLNVAVCLQTSKNLSAKNMQCYKQIPKLHKPQESCYKFEAFIACAVQKLIVDFGHPRVLH